MKRRSREIPVSTFMHRIRKADRDKDVDEMRLAVESGLAGICAFNLSIDARWVIEALDVMRQDWHGQPRWKWLYQNWEEFLDVIQLDAELESWFRQISDARPSATIGEAMQEARDKRAETIREAVESAKNAPLGQHGGRRGLSTGRKKRAGNSAEYVAARLRRDHPAIFSALERGEYPSVRAAALAAGVVKPVPVVKQFERLWSRATEDERAEIAALVMQL